MMASIAGVELAGLLSFMTFLATLIAGSVKIKEATQDG
jgi:hypothetical protein